MNISPVKIQQLPKNSAADWVLGTTIHIPTEILDQLRIRREVIANDWASIKTASLSQLASEMRMYRVYTNSPPTSSRLPISYQNVPPRLRSMFANMIGRVQKRRVSKWAAFPGFPLDLSADAISDIKEPRSKKRQRTPVLLSHDIDSLEGLQNLPQFLKIEEKYKARSSNYVVPCSWPIDEGILRDVQKSGHEIGVHGFDHSGKTPFAEDIKERDRRISGALPFIKKWKVTGYRAPSLLRTKSLIEGLRKTYRYDSSVPTAGGLFPSPNNGCASARPFLLEGMKELPVSMPRDGSLSFLGYSPKEILKIWTECAHQIAASGGVVVLLTHCEERFSGNPDMLAVYEEFLDTMGNSEKFTFSLPHKVLFRTKGN